MRYLIFVFILMSFSGSLYSQESQQETKTHFVIDYVIGENEEFETPYYIFRTEKEYPKIVIDACIHGDELAGALACDTVMKYLEVKEGTVVFIPRVNLKAYKAGTREVNIDLNQVFPGKLDESEYEYKLAYYFMKFIGELEPDVVINLHEAWTRFDEKLYQRQKDKSFGQTLITNRDTIPFFLNEALVQINGAIMNPDNKFRIQYFPYKANHSMDNIISKFNIPSFTVETLRTLPLEERINYHIICILAFLRQAKIEFDYIK